MANLIQHPAPIPAVLANWAPKCNTEMEKRVRIDLEIALSDELIAALPDSIREAAGLVGSPSSGVTSTVIASTFQQTLEFYGTPDHTVPAMTLPSCLLTGFELSRPTPKEGVSTDRFLFFTTTVPAVGPAGGQLAAWLLENLRGTIFLRTCEAQGELPFEATSDEPEEN